MQGYFQSGNLALVKLRKLLIFPLGHILFLHMQLGAIETMAENIVGISKHGYFQGYDDFEYIRTELVSHMELGWLYI